MFAFIRVEARILKRYLNPARQQGWERDFGFRFADITLVTVRSSSVNDFATGEKKLQ